MHLRLIIPFVVIAFPNPLMAAQNSCEPLTIQNWSPDWNRPNCAESTVQVEALGSKAKDEDPHCANESELTNATKVRDAVKNASDAVGAGTGAKIGTAIGGPIGTVVGAVVGKAGAEGLKAVMRNNYHVDFAKCTDVCVHLPVNATNIIVQGWSGPVAKIEGIALCNMQDPQRPGICGLPGGRYDAMSLYTHKEDPELGNFYCSTAKNWSEDQTPTLGLRVMYDLSQ